MNQNVNIFKYIDEDKKYMGFTMIEIISVISVVFSGFIFNLMMLASIGCFASVLVIRYINHLLKISSFKRMLFFYCSDLIAYFYKKQNIFAKHYL